MTCYGCGAMVAQDERFCSECGSRRILLIGRDADCDVRIPIGQVQVSRRHARVHLSAEGLQIEHVGSNNSTRVNGQEVQGLHPLTLTDRVSFGSYVFNTAELEPFLLAKGSHVDLSHHANPLQVAPVHEPPPGPPMDLHAPHASPPVPEARASPVHAPAPAELSHSPSPAQLASAGYIVAAPGKVRSPGVVMALWFLTLGFYGIAWFWMVLDEIRPWRGNQGWQGVYVLMMLVPLVNVFVAIALPFVIAGYVGDLYRREGLMAPVSGAYGLLLFIPLVGLFIYLGLVQSALNGYWHTKNT